MPKADTKMLMGNLRFQEERVGRWAVKAADINQSNKFTSLISHIFDFQAGARIQAG